MMFKPLIKRAVSVAAVGAALVLSACAETETDAKAERPNVLFIFTDDHAIQALSAYGGRFQDIAPTPNLDRLAASGMRFDRATVTNSICGPSRAVILTGKHSHLNGMRANGIDFEGSQQTFPKLLQTAGYETALIGKWHLRSEPTGFDHWEILPGQGSYYNPDFITEAGMHQETGYVTDLITEKAITWLDSERDKAKPFMLMMQHKAPHRNWSPALRHVNLYKDITLPEPENLFDDYATRGTAARVQNMSIEKTMKIGHDNKVWFPGDEESKDYINTHARLNDEQRAVWDAAYAAREQEFKSSDLAAEADSERLVRWKYQQYIKDYLRTVKAVDESVGKMLDFLEDNGLKDNTVVIYSSDQGFYLGEHGWFDKRFMYEQSFRTPLLVSWPGVTQAGTASDALVSNLDYAETILDAAGVEVPVDMQGKSLRPVLEGNEAGWRESLYYRYYEYPFLHKVREHEGVAKKRYKLIHFYKLGEWEFYDLESDPNEMKNRYSDPAYAQIVEGMKQELSALREHYKVDASEDRFVVVKN